MAERVPLSQLDSTLRQQLDSGSLFGTTGFLNLWSEMNGTPVCWIGENAAATTMLPGVEFGKGPAKRFQAMPDGLYMNWVGEVHDAAKTDMLTAVGKYRYVRATAADYDSACPVVDGWQGEDAVASVISLTTDGYQPPDATLRSEVRKAEREGIEVHSMNWPNHGAAFLELMRHTEERHGRKPKYSPSFFEKLAELSLREERIRWLVVPHDGELAASHIFLIHNRTALHWQVYFDKKFSYLKPNQYLLASMIDQFAKAGLSEVNLGATPEGSDSLTWYKDKWGGRERRYQIYSHSSLLGRLL